LLLYWLVDLLSNLFIEYTTYWFNNILIIKYKEVLKSFNQKLKDFWSFF